MAGKTEQMTGEFASVRWSKKDGSWMIGQLKDGTSIVGAAKSEMLIPNVTYDFGGTWETHPSYGIQFKFTSFVAQQPITDGAVMAYLSRFLFGSGAKIGPAAVRKLLAAVGAEKCLATLKGDLDTVVQVCGISKENAKIAADLLIDIEKFENVRMKLVELFQGRGFSQQLIECCIKDFGVAAVQRITRDPFTMLVRRYPSAGFARTDQLYRDLGLNEERLKRQTICVWHLLQQADGSVWIDLDYASGELRRMISARVNPKKAIQLGIRAKWLGKYKDANGKWWISERDEMWNELNVVSLLKDLQRGYSDRTTTDGSGDDGEESGGSVHRTTGQRQDNNLESLVESH